MQGDHRQRWSRPGHDGRPDRHRDVGMGGVERPYEFGHASYALRVVIHAGDEHRLRREVAVELVGEPTDALEHHREVESPDGPVQLRPGALVGSVDLQRHPVGGPEVLPDILTPQQAGVGEDRDPDVRRADGSDGLAEVDVQCRLAVRHEGGVVDGLPGCFGRPRCARGRLRPRRSARGRPLARRWHAWWRRPGSRRTRTSTSWGERC